MPPNTPQTWHYIQPTPFAIHICGCRGLREQGGEASKAAGSELIISLCKAGDRMEALKVYQDMTTPTPTHHQHPPHPPGKKGLSKSAAKRQRAKQRQEAANVTTAVGAVVGTAATAVKAQLAGESSSWTDQLVLDSHDGQAGTKNQTENAPVVYGTTSGARHPALTAEQLPEAVNDQLSSAPSSTSDLSGGSQAPIRADAHQPSTGVASQPQTASITPIKQATASGPSQDHSSGLQATEPPLVPSSSSSSGTSSGSSGSSSDGPASMPAVDTLLLKPDRQQPSSPVEDTHASSASERTDEAPPKLLHHSDPIPHNDTHSSSNPRQQQDCSPGGVGGVGVGLSGHEEGGPKGLQTGAILGKRPVAPASGGGHVRFVGSLKLSQRAICFPSIGATAALVHAFAMADNIQECFRYNAAAHSYYPALQHAFAFAADIQHCSRQCMLRIATIS